MSENSDLERRLSDLERRHAKTREYLVDFSSMVLASVAGMALHEAYPLPGGIYLYLVVFAICYGIIRRVTRWLLRDQG